MWSALRSDFKELTSSLANDGNQVLQKIEKKLIEKPSGDEESNEGEYEESPSILIGDDGEIAYVNPSRSTGEDEESVGSAMQEALRRMADEETYLEPLLVKEVNGVKTSSLKKESEDSDHVNDNEHGDIGVLIYTDEDDPHVIAFLQNFDIESKTDEIASILDRHSDTVKEIFEALVPVELTFEQFWQRYFFRCDETMIRKAWDDYDERMRQERKEMIDKGKQTVSELFGGALKYVKGMGNQDDVNEGNIFEKYQHELEEKKKAMKVSSTVTSVSKQNRGDMKTLGGLFGTGRPPFVMNTAVDEDSSDYENDGEDQINDDADSFGWGSDEEEEIEIEEDSSDKEENLESLNADDSKQEEDDGFIVQELKKELDVTREERDQLHQTVEMLKDQLQIASTRPEVLDQDNSIFLKKQLLEKDSEIANLQARLDDIGTKDTSTTRENDLHIHEMGSEIERLKTELSKKQEAFDELMAKLDSVVEEEDEQDRTLLQEALETINALQAELDESKTSSQEIIRGLQEKYETEIASLRRLSNDNNSEFHDANESFRSTSDSFAKNMEALENTKLDEINELQAQLEDALSEIDTLRSTIEKSKADNQTNTLLSIEAQATINELQSELDSRNAAFEEQIENLKLEHRFEMETVRKELLLAQELLREAESTSSINLEAMNHFEIEKEQMKQLHAEELDRLQMRLQVELNSLEKAEERIASLEAQLDEVKTTTENEVLEKESMIKQLEDARDEALKSASRSAGELSQVRKIISDLESEKAKLEDRITILESDNAEKMREIASLTHALDDAEKRLNEKVELLQMTSLSKEIPADHTKAYQSQASSFSSAVEVEKAEEGLTPSPDEEEDGDDDGWGDDWSDDE
jgi:hypothetical protein